MRKTINISLWLLAGLYLILVLGFVSNVYEDLLCKGVDVVIHDSLEYRFVDNTRIQKMIRSDHPDIAGTPISFLNTEKIEQSLMKVPAIEDVQVYKTVEGLMVVELKQRSPVIRVMDRDRQDYYIDSKGYVIPSRGDYSLHILMSNGFIDGRYGRLNNVLPDQEEGASTGTMKSLLDLATYIDGDPFWKAQIVQIYVNRQGEFELIPRIGSQVIMFGGGDQIEEKFFKLKTLYKEGFSQTGWNQYEIINLRYKNQVICTKR